MSKANTRQRTPFEAQEEEEEELLTSERWWRDRFELLGSHGYQLRPRYRPDWIPSWTGCGKKRLDCEDSIWTKQDSVLDATRVSDGTIVSIKRVPRYSEESSIALFLAPSGDESSDTTNHCVRVLDHFMDESVPGYSFLVMPLLRRFDNPHFFAVDEVLEFIKQTLEGLSHMHSRGVAHRDCAELNIMMDAPSLYPCGFHPVAHFLDPSGERIAPYRRRRDVQRVRYCFIDFGISARFEEDLAQEYRLVTGAHCQDREVPELSAHVPYDPFAVDVFVIGNVYRKSFLDKYENFAFLANLIKAMTTEKPKERPSANEALDLFKKLLNIQSPARLRWRLKPKDSSIWSRMFLDITSCFREVGYLTEKLKRPSSLACL